MLITSADVGAVEACVEEGLSLTSRKRACQSGEGETGKGEGSGQGGGVKRGLKGMASAAAAILAIPWCHEHTHTHSLSITHLAPLVVAVNQPGHREPPRHDLLGLLLRRHQQLRERRVLLLQVVLRLAPGRDRLPVEDDNLRGGEEKKDGFVSGQKQKWEWSSGGAAGKGREGLKA